MADLHCWISHPSTLLSPFDKILRTLMILKAWAGGVFSQVLLGEYPPQIYSIDPWIVYVSVHVLLTGFFQAFPTVSAHTSRK